MENKSVKWLDKYHVLHPDHINKLELEAGIREFGHKQPRHVAEDEAYKDYQTNQIKDAAAHHMVGVKASQAAGDMDSARKHGTMYVLACKALGHEPIGTPHPDITNRAKNNEHKIYKFKGHDGDSFLVTKPDHMSKAEEDFDKNYARYFLEADPILVKQYEELLILAQKNKK